MAKDKKDETPVIKKSTFVAKRPCTYAGRTYKTGDPVQVTDEVVAAAAKAGWKQNRERKELPGGKGFVDKLLKKVPVDGLFMHFTPTTLTEKAENLAKHFYK